MMAERRELFRSVSHTFYVRDQKEIIQEMKSKRVDDCEEPLAARSHEDPTWRMGRQESSTEEKPNRLPLKTANQRLREANRKLVEQAGISQQQIQVLEMQKAELEQANRKLEALNHHLASQAITDGLTGLRNHRAFQEQLALVFEQSVRYQRSLSLVLFDVDHFKLFNDTFGHPAGDAILCRVATVLQESARATDFVARYGGEEFALILLETDAEGAERAAERVRTALAAQTWEQREITVSGGLATLLATMTSPAELLEAADKALYASKAAGRNRMTHAEVGRPR